MTEGVDGTHVPDEAWAPPASDARAAISLPGYADFVEVARGGDSVVYRARQVALDRAVAIKVVDGDNASGGARFTRELQITLGLGRQHPHIVTVLDTGTTGDGRAAIVMDYHDLGSLHDRLTTTGPLPVADVVQAADAVADALDFAHSKGILHRDVKPQNVLLLPTSYVLADFGIARMVDAGHTSSLERFSYRHASPQVLDGQPPATSDDIWSLGSTLFTVLDGRTPFAADDPADDTALAYLGRVRRGERRQIRRDDVPERLLRIVDSCLHPDPQQRPAMAHLRREIAAVQSELVAWQPSAPANAAPPPSHPVAPPPVEDIPTSPLAPEVAASPPVEDVAATPAEPVVAAAVEESVPAPVAEHRPADDVTGPAPMEPAEEPGSPEPEPSPAPAPPAQEPAPAPAEPAVTPAAAAPAPTPAAHAPQPATPAPAPATPTPTPATPTPTPAPAATSAMAHLETDPRSTQAGHPAFDAVPTGVAPDATPTGGDRSDDPIHPSAESASKGGISRFRVIALVAVALLFGTTVGIIAKVVGSGDEPVTQQTLQTAASVPTQTTTPTGSVTSKPYDIGNPKLVPADVALTDQGSSITVTWTDVTEGLADFLVVDVTDGRRDVKAQVQAGSSSYTVEGVDPAQRMPCYQVVAIVSSQGTLDQGSSTAKCIQR